MFPSRRSLLAPAPVAEAELRAAPGGSGALYRKPAEHWMTDWMAGIPDVDVVLQRTGKTRADLRQLLRDSEVSQALDTRREAVLATPWRLEGGGSRASKFIVDALAPHVQHVVATAWDAAQFGYSVLWVDFVRQGGSVTINDVEAPPFEWFRPMPDRSLRYFPENGSGGAHGFECDPLYYFLTARNATSRNPYGEALLSVLYWPVTWRLQGWQLWLNFLDTFGSPIMVGKVSNYNEFIAAMQQQGVTRAVGWQPSGDNESLDAITASGADSFEKLENALDRCIQRVVLGQTLTSDVGDSGSYAAAKVHNEVREDKRRADLRMVVATGQAVVNALWQLNGFTGAPPLFLMQDNVGLETERADRDYVHWQMGVRHSPEYFVEHYDYAKEDFTIVEPPPPQPFGQPKSSTGNKPSAKLAALFAARRFTPEQQVIEDGIDEVLGDLDGIIASAELKAAIRAATTTEELVASLARLLADADPVEFQRVTERALFAADILGYAHAERPQPITNGGTAA